MKVNNIKIRPIITEKSNYPGDDDESFEKFKEQIKSYKPAFMSSSELSEGIESCIVLNPLKNSSIVSEMK